MVGFRNYVGDDAPLTGWVSPSSQQIAFARGIVYLRLFPERQQLTLGVTGSSGFVAINNQDSEWSATFATGLDPGRYCNVFEGPPSRDMCNGNSYVVGPSCPLNHSSSVLFADS